MRDAVQGGLATLLNELNDAMNTWDLSSTRTSTFERAQKRWEAIRHKVDCYAEYLGSEQEKLKAGA